MEVFVFHHALDEFINSLNGKIENINEEKLGFKINDISIDPNKRFYIIREKNYSFVIESLWYSREKPNTFALTFYSGIVNPIGYLDGYSSDLKRVDCWFISAEPRNQVYWNTIEDQDEKGQKGLTTNELSDYILNKIVRL